MIKKSIIILGLILIIDFLLSNLILKKTKIWKYSKLIDQHWRIPSDIYHHAIKPNIDVIEPWGFSLEKRLITNSIGFRDFTNKKITKRSQKKRLLLIGDSAIEGAGPARHPSDRQDADAAHHRRRNQQTIECH